MKWILFQNIVKEMLNICSYDILRTIYKMFSKIYTYIYYIDKEK